MRIVFITDTHVVFKSPDNRRNFIDETLKIFHWLDEKYEELKYDVIFHGGDLMDRGYKQVDQDHLLNFLSVLKRLKEKTKGEMYINIGNHELNFPRHNLFYSIVDVISMPLKNRLITNFSNQNLLEPIFKAPTSLEIGNIVFKFVGFDRNKNYKIPKEGLEDKFVVGLYHDDLVSFESTELFYHHKIGHGISLKDSDIMENVNIALCGHIHTPLEDITLSNERKTLVIVPGSPISRTTSEIHSSIRIPIMDIDIETGKFELSFETYYLQDQDESFLEEVVKNNKEKYELSKQIQQDKSIARNKSVIFENLIDTIEDTEIKRILLEIIETNSLQLEEKVKEVEERYLKLL